MKKLLVLLFALSLNIISGNSQEKKVLRGFDGGMMIHTGFVQGAIAPIDYSAKGAPFGIGGVIRLHLGNHWRIGSEGYVSTLSQMGNGSYIKYGWGGLLGDFYWAFDRFMPYIGLTIGGGATTYFLMKESPASEWSPVNDAYYHKQGFMAFDPFVGCDYIVSEAFHLTLKIDCLMGMSKNMHIPSGPRLYLGFIFYH